MASSGLCCLMDMCSRQAEEGFLMGSGIVIHSRPIYPSASITTIIDADTRGL